jgi:hypothetical protein
LRIDRSAVTCFDRHRERDLVRRSAPSLSSFFTTLVGIVDLYIASKLVDGRRRVVPLARVLRGIRIVGNRTAVGLPIGGAFASIIVARPESFP